MVLIEQVSIRIYAPEDVTNAEVLAEAETIECLRDDTIDFVKRSMAAAALPSTWKVKFDGER